VHREVRRVCIVGREIKQAGVRVWEGVPGMPQQHQHCSMRAVEAGGRAMHVDAQVCGAATWTCCHCTDAQVPL
jgi:hypothetical protein